MHAHVTNVAVRTIKEGRLLRVQPYNEYRKRFNLKPYTSFREFTGERTVDLQLLHFHESTCAYILGINGIHPIQALLFFEASECLTLLSLQWDIIALHKCGISYHQTDALCCLYRNCGRHFADNEEIARELEEFYGDIDALEFYPGLLLEKARPGATFGESIVEMGAPFSLKGLMGNPICSPEYWKPSTFGGRVGFDIVNSASLKKLVCLNVKRCPYVAFSVPRDEKPHGSNDGKARTDEL